MRIYTKINGQLKEGISYNKKQLKLREVTNTDAVSASIGNNVKTPTDAINNAATTLNQNHNVNNVSFQPNQVDGQQNTNTGEGQQINVDVSNKAEAIKQVTDAAKDPSKKDAKIVAYDSKTSQLNTVVTPKGTTGNVSLENSSYKRNGKLIEMRKNAVRFNKRDLNEYLKLL